jgi:hypothetical protein
VRRLERRAFPPEDEGLRKVIEQIRERRRRYMQEQELPFYDHEPLPLVLPDGRRPTLIDAILHGRICAMKRYSQRNQHEQTATRSATQEARS